MNRRRFLGAAGVAGASTLAGCGLFETRSIRAPPVVENRPDAVYVPTHVEGMGMAGMQTAGRYACGLFFSFPHRFWLINSTRRNMVELESSDSLHLMTSIWDRETSTVLTGADATIRIERDGEVVAEKPPWPMLSQNMGVHFGDNYALEGDGTYRVVAGIGPVGIRTTGALAGAFTDGRTVTFDLDFSQSELQELDFRELTDRAGTPGAVAPMEMEMLPSTQVPPASELPGDLLREATSGDGVFLPVRLTEPPDGVDAEGAYLAVSARTPHNRYPLPMMSLSARLDRDGSTVFDDWLTATLDPDIGYHYGAPVESIESGDELTLVPGAPPQVPRHEGYEMAFLRMDEMQLSVAF